MNQPTPHKADESQTSNTTRKWRHKVSFYQDPADTDRVRGAILHTMTTCLLYTSPSPRDKRQSRMPSSA